MSERLKYIGTSIVMQEIPDEISLAINISGCRHQCEGCHSSYLWEYKGRYLLDDIAELLLRYDGLITCVCIMGGDQNIDELNGCIEAVQSSGYKCGLYLGCDNIPDGLKVPDYIKIGHYDKKCGGLDSPTTNQRMYKYDKGKFIDITERFRHVKDI